MIKFKGEIVHNKETIKLMFATEKYTYNLLGIIYKLIIGAVLLILALTVNLNSWLQVIFFAIGSWLIVSRDFSSSMKAEDTYKARGGNLPRMKYEFSDKGIYIDGEGKSTFAYDKVDRLVYSKDYLYIFFGKNSVCMIDKKTIEPNNEENFLEYITEKTAITWKTNSTILSFNFFDLVRTIKDRKNK